MAKVQINDLDAAAALDGTELVEIEQAGQSAQCTTQDIADLAGAPYLKYVALLSQADTDAPTATVLENTLGGTVVWTRDSAGYYLGTLASAFTISKTFVLVTHDGNNGATGYMGGGRNDASSVFVTFQGSDGNFLDILGENSIEIRVYP